MMADNPDEESVDQDSMAAEWEAAAGGAPAAQPDFDSAGEDAGGGSGGGGGGGTAEAGRVLNQNEIDSLLGFDGGNGDDQSKTGIQAILNSSLVSYERLPMLEVVFDRLVRTLSTSLRNFTSDNVEVNLDNITSTRFGDYVNSIPLPAMLSVFRAEEWDNFGLITIDSSLIYSIVDVLLGGRRGTAAMRIEGRPYTTIERHLVERLIKLFLQDLELAFEPLSPVKFLFDRLETNPRFATIARPANAAILVKLKVDMEDRGGRIDLLLPYATIEPVRELLLQMFLGEKFGRDSIWEGHLATELWSTDLDVQAVLDERSLTLREVMALEVGSTILLNTTPQSVVELRCGGVPMLGGHMGRLGRSVAIKVDRVLQRVPAEVVAPPQDAGEMVQA
jgi:flagellar motor switch protein FliM